MDSFAGKQLSAMTARFWLVEPNRETQAPFLSAEGADSEPDSLLSSLGAVVLQHIDRPIRLRDVASSANITVRSLFRYFKKVKGISPLEFVQLLRIERSKQLLVRTREPLELIVPKCGNQDVSSFRKLFRKRVGLTPKEYRQRFGRLV